jgi:hypothetical protein|tara:strand:+ start:9287 stop:9535 length:249 start_codon:yes stop_codon:yes gene_type:complete
LSTPKVNIFNSIRWLTGEQPMIKNLSLNLEVGQEILVGKNNKRARITKIEFHEKSGEVTINTTQGPRKALTFRLMPDLEYAY